MIDICSSMVLLLCLLLTRLSSDGEGHTISASWLSHEARSSCKRRDESHCLRRLNDTVAMGKVSYLAKHSSRATVASLGKLDRAGHRFRLNMVSGDDVLDGNLNKHHGMLFSAHTRDMHLVGGHILAFLAHNRDDIHPGTASQADEQQLHRAKALVVSSVVFCCIERDMMARTCFYLEAHASRKFRLHSHRFCHDYSLLSFAYANIRISIRNYTATLSLLNHEKGLQYHSCIAFLVRLCARASTCAV